MIKENIREVEERIEQACMRSGRKREDVTLIAVSKTKPVSMIYDAIEAGLTNFGENKVQELCEKTEIIKEDLHWHMIGHLQRNKVKYLIDKKLLIHSVDSIRLAEQIDMEADKKNLVQDVLIEVNIALEDTKYGVLPEALESLVREVSKLPGINIRGLMCVAPYTENAEDNRIFFQKMRQLLVDINAKNIDNVIKGSVPGEEQSIGKLTLDILSMGMTNDYEVAIEEGATLVRVGTGIFGERNYNV